MNKAVHGLVRALGGSISAEHGIGQLKRDELLATAPPVGIELMRRIKAAFDPAGIMNPGKMITVLSGLLAVQTSFHSANGWISITIFSIRKI